MHHRTWANVSIRTETVLDLDPTEKLAEEKKPGPFMGSENKTRMLISYLKEGENRKNFN